MQKFYLPGRREIFRLAVLPSSLREVREEDDLTRARFTAAILLRLCKTHFS
jgi:hypothetical protein